MLDKYVQINGLSEVDISNGGWIKTDKTQKLFYGTNEEAVDLNVSTVTRYGAIYLTLGKFSIKIKIIQSGTTTRS